LTPSFRKKCGFPAIFHAIAAPVNGDDLGMMQEPVEQGGGQDLILECIVMPPSFIALLVEDMLEVWSDPRLRDSPSTSIRLLGS